MDQEKMNVIPEETGANAAVETAAPPAAAAKESAAPKALREKAAPRRVGTLTMGSALVVTGVAILAYMIFPSLDLSWVGWLAPVILIILGLEIILRYAFHKDGNYKYDVLSAFISITMVITCLGISAVREWIPYISPARYAAERQMSRQFEEDVYAALRSETDLSNVYTNMSVEPVLFTGGADGEGAFAPSYTRVSVHFQSEFATEEAFAERCHTILKKLTAANIPSLDHLEFYAEGPNCRYDLSLYGRYRLGMDASGLEGETRVTKYEPDPADGWLPGGYDEMVEQYGQEAADRFLEEAVRLQNERLGIPEDGELPEEQDEPGEVETEG